MPHCPGEQPTCSAPTTSTAAASSTPSPPGAFVPLRTFVPPGAFVPLAAVFGALVPLPLAGTFVAVSFVDRRCEKGQTRVSHRRGRARAGASHNNGYNNSIGYVLRRDLRYCRYTATSILCLVGPVEMSNEQAVAANQKLQDSLAQQVTLRRQNQDLVSVISQEQSPEYIAGSAKALPQAGPERPPPHRTTD